MCNGIDDGYSEGTDPILIGYDPGVGDKSACVIVGGGRGEIVVLGSDNNHSMVAGLAAAMAEASMAMAIPYHLLGRGGNSRPVFPRTKRKPERICLLPGCDNRTTHRGGYCCAEHCFAHRKKPLVRAAEVEKC